MWSDGTDLHQGHARDTFAERQWFWWRENILVPICKHMGPGVFMYLSLNNGWDEYSSLTVASLLLSSGFNKMLFPSHGPSWSLQSDVTLIAIGLHALRVLIKQWLMMMMIMLLLLLLLRWFWLHRFVRKCQAICLPGCVTLPFLTQLSGALWRTSDYSVSCKQIISHHSVTHETQIGCGDLIIHTQGVLYMCTH